MVVLFAVEGFDVGLVGRDYLLDGPFGGHIIAAAAVGACFAADRDALAIAAEGGVGSPRGASSD